MKIVNIGNSNRLKLILSILKKAVDLAEHSVEKTWFHVFLKSGNWIECPNIFFYFP